MREEHNRYYGNRATMTAPYVQLYETVDRAIDVVDTLYDQVAVLITVWGALGNDKLRATYGTDYCLDTLADAADRVATARDKLNARVNEIVGNA